MEWPRVKPRDTAQRRAPGVYADLDELIRLKYSARDFSLRPRQPVHSVLAGRKASRLRGRGLDFEELRGYLPGDDVRNIDWKATARIRKPQVRVYLEERDRPCLLVVDQRMGMFFGSRERMKSVTAAECAALAAWRAVDQGDRIGAVVFNDAETSAVRPLRSSATVTRVLSEIVRFTRHLRVDQPIETRGSMVNAALDHAARTAKHDALVVVISDFAGADEESRRLWTRIAAHNDTLAVHVVDPLEQRLPDRARLSFQDRDRQIEIDSGSRRLREGFAAGFESRAQRARDFLGRVATPVLTISTAVSVVDQVRAQLGRASEVRA